MEQPFPSPSLSPYLPLSYFLFSIKNKAEVPELGVTFYQTTISCSWSIYDSQSLSLHMHLPCEFFRAVHIHTTNIFCFVFSWKQIINWNTSFVRKQALFYFFYFFNLETMVTDHTAFDSNYLSLRVSNCHSRFLGSTTKAVVPPHNLHW